MKLRFLFCLLSFVLLVGPPVQAKDDIDPRYPQRQYRRFLLPNEMKVLLISDPTVNHASAGLSVNSGSLNDPLDAQGMSHFLEHLLFLGTEKYPEVDDYEKFISSHDGNANASTHKDTTNYHFQISSDHLQGGLDRFSQFFIAPLFNPEYVKREIMAVNAEYLDKKPSEFWRNYQVESTVFVEGHPERIFRPGNLETLGKITREDLLKFYRSHYSGNLMTLVVLGKEDLDTLQSWVAPRFSKVPNYHLEVPKYPKVFLPKSEELRVLRIQPLKDIRTMKMTFALPSMSRFYKSKPMGSLGHLLGHEGSGSLLSLLKKGGLVTGLSAGGGSDRDYGRFDITIQLTPKGVKEYKTIVTRVFQYIRMLRQKGLPRYVFEENKIMSDIEYRFAEKWEGSNLTSGFARLMQYYPLSVVEKAPFLITEYKPHHFDSVLYRLTPDNFLVTLIAQKLKTDQVEPYFGAEYSFSSGDSQFIQKLKRIKPHPALSLPEENIFIPRDLSLVPSTTPFRFTHQSIVGLRMEGIPETLLSQLEKVEGQAWTSWSNLQEAFSPEAPDALDPFRDIMMKHALIIPKKILDNEKGTIWFQQDLKYGSPKAEISLRFHTPETYRTPRHAVLSQLYAIAIEEGLNEFGYSIKLAGLGYGLGNGKEGISINFSGFSDRILELSKAISSKLKTITIDAQTLEIIKERQYRRYRNMRFDSAVRQAFYQQSLLLEDKKHSIYQYQDLVRGITLKELKAYVKTLYDRTFVEGVLVGNIEEVEARQAIEAILKNINSKPLPKAKRFEESIVRINDNQNYTFSKKADLDNSAIVLMVEVGPESPKLKIATQIIATILRSRIYTELRTKQQLGYNVSGSISQREGILGFYFLIQSGKYPAGLLQEKIESFIPSFVEEFKNLPESTFETVKRSIINGKLEKNTNIEEDANELFYLAFKKDARFDLLSEELRAAESLTKADVVQALENYLTTPHKGRLAIRIVGKNHEDSPIKGTAVKSIKSFKATQSDRSVN